MTAQFIRMKGASRVMRDGHVAAALDNLPDELVVRESHRDAVQSWPPLSASVAKRVTVATLLHLKHQGALPL